MRSWLLPAPRLAPRPAAAGVVARLALSGAALAVAPRFRSAALELAGRAAKEVHP